MKLNILNRIILLILLSPFNLLFAHGDKNRAIEFPDIPGFKTLVCDLHIHTVFSDGSVWPNIRVMEAEKDHLDVLAITEHLEYQPWKDDIPHPDRNRSYDYANQFAENTDVMVINGSEITRGMPPGHANAIFIKDANKLLVDDPMDAFKEARNQDAFIFWNHPYWIAQSPDAKVILSEMNLELINTGLMDGIEVVNDTTFSDHALQVALDYNLTILGTSDIHDLIDWQYKVPAGGHRPVTLVFATEKTKPALKRALKKGRTVVWFNDKLIGKREHLLPLINASLSISSASYIRNSTVVHTKIKNNSDAPFMLRNQSLFDFYNSTDVVTVPPHGEAILDVRVGEKKRKFTLEFEVLNALTAPATHPVISLEVRAQP
jgi:hypothetical protein